MILETIFSLFSRYFHEMVVLDNQLYVLGGEEYYRNPLKVVERLDDNKWTVLDQKGLQGDFRWGGSIVVE